MEPGGLVDLVGVGVGVAVRDQQVAVAHASTIPRDHDPLSTRLAQPSGSARLRPVGPNRRVAWLTVVDLPN